MAADGAQKEMMEMMKGMKGAFEGLATKVDGSIAAPERLASDFTAKFDSFAKSFKEEVLG